VLGRASLLLCLLMCISLYLQSYPPGKKLVGFGDLKLAMLVAEAEVVSSVHQCL
jgi:hypothetical protein